MNYLYIGKMVNTHGIKGEVRILSSFKYKKRIFQKDFPLYFGKEKVKEIITSYRAHKQFDMVTLQGYTNINDVLKYKGSSVYVYREDLKLEEGEFLNEDLIHCEVWYGEKKLGTLIKIEQYPAQEMLVIKGEKTYLIPYVPAFIENINLAEHKIKVKPVKGLI